MLDVIERQRFGGPMSVENQVTTVDLESIATFLPDLPLDQSPKDGARFGHGGVAETLRTVVRRCDAPFTIALYGSWGTGKSSVVGILKRLLEADDIPTIIVDVWKYQDDSLRRTVLKEMDGQGRKDYPEYFDVDGFGLDDRVEQSTSLATEFKLGFESVSLRKGLKESRLTQNLLLLLVGMLILIVVGFFTYPEQTVTMVSSIAAGVAAVLVTLEASALLLTPKTRTWAKGKYADPYEFQDEFMRVLVQGFSKAEKVLVVFDNLDRVGEDKTVEVLTTVKTFLESVPAQGAAKAVFLVPCDGEAIRAQVRKRFGNGEEFLRKFFNVSLRLPDFLHTELQDYTLDLLQQTNIPALNDQRIAWMTAKAFRSNPRQTKQFVNVLLAEYLLAHRRSITHELPPLFAEDMVMELALFQILATRFPDELEKCVRDGHYSLKPLGLDVGGEFERFIRQVSHEAQIADVRSWLTLRRSDHEAKLPGVEQFVLDIMDGNTEAASAFIAGIGNDDDARHNLSLAVQLRMATVASTTSFVVALNTLLDALDRHDRLLEPTAVRELLTTALAHMKSAPELSTTRLDPRLLATVLGEHAQQRPDFLDAWAMVLREYSMNTEVKRDGQFLSGLMSVLAIHPDWFSSQESIIAPALVQVVGNDEDVVRELAESVGAETWLTE